MSNKYYNGGSAFPVPMVAPEGDFMNVQSQGMTLRDWFAGQALCGLMAHHGVHDLSNDLPESAYTIADEMLEKRCDDKQNMAKEIKQ